MRKRLLSPPPHPALVGPTHSGDRLMARVMSCAPGALALGVFVSCALAGGEPPSADWAMFRGPKRDNRSPDQGLLTSWPKAGPTLLWKSPGVGVGFSSVAVAGDKGFTMGDKGDSSHVFAID